MATPAHHRADSNASTLTALSDSFNTKVQDNINCSESTTSIVRKAREHLQKLKRDQGRLLDHPSSLPTHRHVDPHNILLSMLDHAPTARGQRYAACAIISCDTETLVLVDLANTWLRYVLLVFKGNSDARDIVASEQATPTLRDTEVDLESINRWRKNTFRDHTLQRDGFRCPLSGWYDWDYEPEDPEASMAKLETAHILKRAVAVFDDRQRSSAFSTWDIIRQYADWPDNTLEKMMSLIDTPENGMMLEHNFHNSFEEFYWTLVPETTSMGETVPHTYRVKVLKRMPGIPYKKVITFKDHSKDESSEGSSSKQTSKPNDIPLPNPQFLALHAALAHVLHMSGAGEAIDLYMDRSSQHGPAVPSTKIRHADELAIYLSQMALEVDRLG